MRDAPERNCLLRRLDIIFLRFALNIGSSASDLPEGSEDIRVERELVTRADVRQDIP